MKETPTKLAAYFAVGGAWAVFSGLVGLVGKPGFTTLLAIAKLALGIAFLVSARQFNESLVHSPQKLQCPLWGAGAWMIVWFLAREFGDNSQTGTTLADNVFTLVWFVSVLLILWYLRENVLRLSAAARLNATAARIANFSVSTHRVWREDRSWDALAGFALVSGALPIMLLGYVAQFKLFGRALAFSFYTGLRFLFLLLIVWILVSSALWSVAAVAVWYRRRLGVLFLAILCGLRFLAGALFVLLSLKIGFLSLQPGANLSPHLGQSIVFMLVVATAVYGAGMICSWRCYRSA